MKGGYYAPYIKRLGKKKAYQLGRQRMKSMGLNAMDRNNIQHTRKKQDARAVRRLHSTSLPMRTRKGRKMKVGKRSNILSKWRNFLEDYKNEHKWYLVKNGVRSYPKSYKQLLKDASRVWKNSKINLN